MTYTPTQRAIIGRYASRHGVTSALTKFKKDFPNLNASTISRVKRAYIDTSGEEKADIIELPEKKRGRPSILPTEVAGDLDKWILRLRDAGGIVNVHVINAALFGIISSKPLYSQYMHFVPTRGWRVALYKRLNLSRRRATTSRPPISEAAYKEVVIRYHHNVCYAVRTHSIPDGLVITIDQTPSKYMEVSKQSMALRNSKRVAISNSDDKRAITLTLGISLDGTILPYQLIYTGKTKRCLPDRSLFPDGFLLSYNPSHWSNEVETKKLLQQVIHPYFESTRERLGLPPTQKALLIWDDFKAHKTASVCQLADQLNILQVGIPANFTHLLSPLDLTVNKKLKEFEKREFSTYFSETLSKIIAANPTMDIAEVKVDTKLSTLKPLHALSVAKSFQYFQTVAGKNNILSGWRGAGLVKAVDQCRNMEVESIIDPFANLNLV